MRLWSSNGAESHVGAFPLHDIPVPRRLSPTKPEARLALRTSQGVHVVAGLPVRGPSGYSLSEHRVARGTLLAGILATAPGGCDLGCNLSNHGRI